MKIAIGVGENKDVLEAIKQFDIDIKLAYSNEELLDYIKNPEIDGVIRGSLESNVVLELKKEYPDIFRASILEKEGYKFMLAPVGIDECDDIVTKEKIIIACSDYLLRLGIKPKIALISGGRKQDKGRSSKIDKSIDECEEIVSHLGDKYNIKHYYILIENAIKDKNNIIIAPDGIIGNIIFRSLVLVAGITSYGAIALKQPNLYIDTSRSQNVKGYVNSINLMKHIIESQCIEKE